MNAPNQARLIAALKTLPSQMLFDTGAETVYAAALIQVPDEATEELAKRLALRCKWRPSAAEVLETAYYLVYGAPSPDEALAMLPSADEAVLWTDDIAATYAETAEHIDSTDTTSRRRAFLAAYTRRLNASITAFRAPVWSVRFGKHPYQNIEVAREGIKAGRLPGDYIETRPWLLNEIGERPVTALPAPELPRDRPLATFEVIPDVSTTDLLVEFFRRRYEDPETRVEMETPGDLPAHEVRAWYRQHPFEANEVRIVKEATRRCLAAKAGPLASSVRGSVAKTT